MIYTPEEKRELDSIIAAFGTYIKSQSYFDIVYSDRIGYVSLLLKNTDDGTVVFRSVRQLLLYLFDDVVYNAVFAALCPDDANFNRPLTECEQDNVRHIILERLEPLDKGSEYLALLDAFLQDYPQRNE